jgi:beta-galactosidase
MLFGVDYYPEQWTPADWPRDADRMREWGVGAARMMEFAWAVIEPEEGRFDFSLFDAVIDILHSRGIKSVLGTPTAAAPAWLAARDLSVLGVYIDGTPRAFGTRREACLNSPRYREAARRVTAEIARRYGGDSRVIGFQIDNELGHEGSDRCICPNCAKEWPRWLEARYSGDIGRLNEAWGNVFWSRCFGSFSEVPLPGPHVASTHNPALMLDYYRFMADTARIFVAEQAGIIRAKACPGQWITTNLFPTPLSCVYDFQGILEPMDFPGFDNYPVWGDQDEPMPYYFASYLLELVRGLKGGGPFAVLEQFSNVQGHWRLGYAPPPEQAALWTEQAIARGADKVFWFRYRTARRAQEQLCYGILDPDGSLSPNGEAILKRVGEGRASYEGWLSAKPEARACVLHDRANAWLLRDQQLSTGLSDKPASFMETGYDREVARACAPFVLHNVPFDLRPSEGFDPSPYALISLPLYQMADPALAERLGAWVKCGGVLVLGYRSGSRDRENAAWPGPLPGPFAEMAGIEVRAFEALGRNKLKGRRGIIPLEFENWVDIVEPHEAEVLARVSDRRKWYSGAPLLTRNAWGGGAVYYLASSPGALAILLLYRRIMGEAGLKPRFKGVGVEIVERKRADGSLARFILNHSPRARRVMGRRLPPWGSAVLG